MPTIKGKIESAQFLKSGQGAKGPWVMFEVMVAGQKFTAFGDSWQKNVGQEGEFEYKEEQRTSARGTSYMSRTLQTPRRPGSVNPQQLTNIENMLKEVLTILKNQQPLVTGQEGPLPDGPQDGDINVDDIPF